MDGQEIVERNRDYWGRLASQFMRKCGVLDRKGLTQEIGMCFPPEVRRYGEAEAGTHADHVRGGEEIRRRRSKIPTRTFR